MSALEHLLMQIFDRKAWIERQLWQQVESYSESLAYHLLSVGRRPPPWLWTPGFDSQNPKAPSSKITGGPALPELSGSRQSFKEDCLSTSTVKEHRFFTQPADKTHNIGITVGVSDGSMKEKPWANKQHTELPPNFPTSVTASRRSKANPLASPANQCLFNEQSVDFSRSESKFGDAKPIVSESTPVLLALNSSSAHLEGRSALLAPNIHLHCSGHQEMHDCLETLGHAHDSHSRLCAMNQNSGGKQVKETINCPFQEKNAVHTGNPVLLSAEVNETSVKARDVEVALLSSGKGSAAKQAEVTIAAEMRDRDSRYELMLTCNKTPEVFVEAKVLYCPGSSPELTVDKTQLVAETPEVTNCNAKGLDHAVENHANLYTAVENKIEVGDGKPGARYFLRSLVRHDNGSSLKFNERNSVSNLERPLKTQLWASGNSWPKRRKLNSLNSQNVSNSWREIQANTSRTCRKSQAVSSPSNMEVKSTAATVDSCSDVLSQSKEKCLRKGSPCLMAKGQAEGNSLIMEEKEVPLDTEEVKDGALRTASKCDEGDILLNRTGLAETSYSKGIDDHLCALKISNHETSKCSGISVKTIETGIHDKFENLGASDMATFPDQVPMLQKTKNNEVFGHVNDVGELVIVKENDIGTTEFKSTERYYLQSSIVHDRESYLKSIEANSQKKSIETQFHTSGKSWPQNIKMNSLRMNPANATGASRKFQVFSLPSNIGTERAVENVESFSDVISQDNENRLREGSFFLIAKDSAEENKLPLEQKEVPFPIDASASSLIRVSTVASTLGGTEIYASENPDHVCAGNASMYVRLKSSGCSIKSNEKASKDDLEGLHGFQNGFSPEHNNKIADFHETMPEIDGFNVDLPYIIEEDIFNAAEIRSLEKHASLLDLLRSSRNMLPEVYRSLPTGLLESMKTRHSFHVKDDDCKQFSASENCKFSQLGEMSGLEEDYGSFMGKSHSDSMMYRASYSRKPPLTPLVGKSSQRRLSGRSEASMENNVGSDPDFMCFRIDENNSDTKENDQQDEHDMFGERDRSRKALQDVTAVYQNAPIPERVSLELVNTVEGCTGKKMMKNLSTLVLGNGLRKTSESFRSRFSKTEVSGQENGRNGSRSIAEIGIKSNNIVSHISSFIPLVRQKQQATTMNRKKDVRVKALEVAEVAKHLEEKKQNEREMRKAAAKVERERLKQEKELKHKQEEQKKKNKLGGATRKRHREDGEKMEIKRKRKCNLDSRKLPKQPTERVEKDQRSNDPVEEVNRHLKWDKVGGIACEKVESSCVSAIVQETLKVQNVTERPYEMSPCRDSDEDDEDEDAEEETRRRRKSVPSWARREILDQILLSDRHLDPREIFARKCCFNLSEVLTAHAPRRQF